MSINCVDGNSERLGYVVKTLGQTWRSSSLKILWNLPVTLPNMPHLGRTISGKDHSAVGSQQYAIGGNGLLVNSKWANSDLGTLMKEPHIPTLKNFSTS